MSLIIPNSLTDTDRNLIESIYAHNYTAMIADVENHTIPEGIEADDIVLYLLQYTQDANFLDPDNSNMDYLWSDTAVQQALLTFRDDNRTDTSLQSLVDDIEAFLNAGDVPTDVINDAARILEEYSNILDNTGDASNSELANLATFFKQANPYFYYLLYFMYEMAPNLEEREQAVLDQLAEVTDEINATVDEYADIDFTDTESATVDQKELDVKLQNLQQVQRAFDEVFKQLTEIKESALEMISSGFQRTSGATRSIIQNMG